jgi:hypothetical protein
VGGEAVFCGIRGREQHAGDRTESGLISRRFACCGLFRDPDELGVRYLQNGRCRHSQHQGRAIA